MTANALARCPGHNNPPSTLATDDARRQFESDAAAVLAQLNAPFPDLPAITRFGRLAQRLGEQASSDPLRAINVAAAVVGSAAAVAAAVAAFLDLFQPIQAVLM